MGGGAPATGARPHIPKAHPDVRSPAAATYQNGRHPRRTRRSAAGGGPARGRRLTRSSSSVPDQNVQLSGSPQAAFARSRVLASTVVLTTKTTSFGLSEGDNPRSLAISCRLPTARAAPPSCTVARPERRRRRAPPVAAASAEVLRILVAFPLDEPEAEKLELVGRQLLEGKREGQPGERRARFHGAG